jgi:ESCRT-II complex subunit VPS22
MRRKVGVSAARKKDKEAAAYSTLGKSLEESKIASVKGVLSSFQDSLTEFGKKHRDRINKDPEFRHQFHTM